MLSLLQLLSSLRPVVSLVVILVIIKGLSMCGFRPMSSDLIAVVDGVSLTQLRLTVPRIGLGIVVV